MPTNKAQQKLLATIRRSIQDDRGFGIVEAMIGAFLLLSGLLIMAAAMGASVGTEQYNYARQRALEAAQQEAAKLKSLPFDKIWVDTTFQNDPDWAGAVCPLKTATNSYCRDSGRMVFAPSGTPALTDPYDPRWGKLAPERNFADATSFVNAIKCADPALCYDTGSVKRHGTVLYVYVYWNNWQDTTKPRLYKVITIIAKFRDPEAHRIGQPYNSKSPLTPEEVRQSSVRYTTIAADIPDLGDLF